MSADGVEQRLAETLEHAARRELEIHDAEVEAQSHLADLREAGIPPAFEADAMASFRQARHLSKTFDQIFGARTWSEPLHCRHDRALGNCAQCEMERGL